MTEILTAFLGYVLPYGQMSLWGILMPQTYNLDLFIILIIVASLATGEIHTKVKGIYRIGPPNTDIVSVIFGSLLGDAHAEKRALDRETRISFFQEETYLKALPLYISYIRSFLMQVIVKSKFLLIEKD